MECAGGACAVAEECDGDLAVLAELGAESRAGGDGDAGADDAVGAQVAEFDVGDVHGAALAAAVAGGTAEEFGHHLVHARALGNAVAVAAVGAGDEVAVVQGGADAGGGGFLPDVEVQGAAHLGRAEGFFGGFFEAADAPHDPVDPAKLVVGELLQHAVGSVVAPSAAVGGDRLLLCQGAPPFASGRDCAAAAGPNRFTVPAAEYIRVGLCGRVQPDCTVLGLFDLRAAKTLTPALSQRDLCVTRERVPGRPSPQPSPRGRGSKNSRTFEGRGSFAKVSKGEGENGRRTPRTGSDQSDLLPIARRALDKPNASSTDCDRDIDSGARRPISRVRQHADGLGSGRRGRWLR